MKPGVVIGIAGGLLSILMAIGGLIWQTAQKFADLEHRIAAMEKATAPAWQGDYAQAKAEDVAEQLAKLRAELKRR